MTSGTRARAAASLLLALAWGTAAADAWDLEALFAQLAANGHPPLSYTETRESAFLEVPLVSRGTLQVLEDGSLVKERRSPAFQRITIGQGRIQLEGADGQRRSLNLSDIPGLEGFAGGLTALFHGDPQALRERFTTQLSGSPKQWRLALTPLDQRLQTTLRQIELDGGSATLQRIRILEADGDSTLLKLEPIKQ